MKKNNLNPWKEFQTWLYSPNMDLELSEDIIRGINPRSVLLMFSGLYDLTIELNDLFNNFNVIFSIDSLEFYNFLKQLVHKKKLTRYDMIYLKMEKIDKIMRESQKKMPHLDKDELGLLIKLCQKSEEEEGFLEFLGLTTVKIKKLTKKEKERLKEEKNNPTSIVTMKDWIKNFRT